MRDSGRAPAGVMRGAGVTVPDRGHEPTPAPCRLAIQPGRQVAIEAEPHRAAPAAAGFPPEQQHDMQGLARGLRQLAAAGLVEVHRYPGRGLEVTLSDLSGGGVP